MSRYSIFSSPFLFFPLSVWAGFLTWVCGVLLFACSLWCGFPQGSVLPAITAVPMVITDTLSQNKHMGMFIYGGPHSESTAGLPLSAFLQTRRRDLLVLSLSLYSSLSLLAFRNILLVLAINIAHIEGLGIWTNFLTWASKHPSNKSPEPPSSHISTPRNHPQHTEIVGMSCATHSSKSHTFHILN